MSSEPVTDDELNRLQDMAGQCAINARLTGVVEDATIACLQLVPHLIAEVRRLRADNRGWEARYDMLLTEIGGKAFDAELAAENTA